MTGMFEERVKCLEQEQGMAGYGKANVEGVLKGANCWQGFGVGGPFFARNVEGSGIVVSDSNGLHGNCRRCRRADQKRRKIP